MHTMRKLSSLRRKWRHVRMYFTAPGVYTTRAQKSAAVTLKPEIATCGCSSSSSSCCGDDSGSVSSVYNSCDCNSDCEEDDSGGAFLSISGIALTEVK